MIERIYIPCPLCDRDEADQIFENGEITIVRCRHCAFMYQNPRRKDTLDRENAESYYESFLDLDSNKFQKMLFREKCDEFLSHLTRGTVLDVGCGVGHFMEVASERGWKPFGIDVSPWAYSYLSSRGYSDIFNCILEEAKFRNEFFDAINLNHILEHVPSPCEFFAEVHRVLKPEGIVLIEVPNENRFPYNYKMINMLKPRHMASRETSKKHLNLFTKRTLKVLIQKSNLIPLIVREEGFVSQSRIMTPAFSQKTHLIRLGLLFSMLRIDLVLGLGRYIVGAAKKP